jgi:SAM-dependent methyltransferase
VIHEAAARGFAQAVGAYERGRPGYPPDAVERLCEAVGIGPGRAVLDLAAGTGKLTRLLVPTGAVLVAVEPVEQMRAALARTLPEVTALAGTAEDLPLPDDSVDVVVAGSAFHWFRGDEALAEIHRVLRRGGRVGLLWNVRDESVRWVAELTEIMEPYRGDAPGYRSGAWKEAFAHTALFSPLRCEEFRHVHRLEPEAVAARVASVSFVAALSEGDRATVLARVRALLARHPATRGREVVELPYRTDLWWCAALRG